MLISITFSAVIYNVLNKEFKRFERAQRFRIERSFPNSNENSPRVPIPTNPELIEETRQRILLMLSLVNSGIFILAGGLAYFLAARTLNPISEMVDEQNRFIADASHELKTPLTALKSSLEVNLRDKNLSIKDARSLIGDSISEVNKLQSLSENLLELAQYQKPNHIPKFEVVSISQISEDAVNKIKPLANLKKITVQNQIKEHKVKGSRENLTELLVILLDNAIKYSPQKSKILLSSRKNEDTIVISVKDQGIGIEEKDLPHIFDRFYHSSPSRSKNEAWGYGLGLAIAQKIAQSHRGSIRIESKPKLGSVFEVSLPTE